MTRTFLAGADVVLPDRVAAGKTVVLEQRRIADIVDRAPAAGADERLIVASGQLIVPGFIDVHVHGVRGIDTLDGDGAIAAMARALPRFGVTAFCPTTIACDPTALAACLAEVGRARIEAAPDAARVLPAHLESNFINPDYAGAQPVDCLRATRPPDSGGQASPRSFTAADILDTIDRFRADVGIVTLAPEIDGGIDLVRRFCRAGVRVSLGHTGATFDEAMAAVAAGARHATHLFNRMRPMTHREPGVAGAALASDDVTAEIICDGHHVHPAMVQTTIAAKGPSRTLAISDGTAGSGLSRGARAQLGGRPIVVDDVARLDDGTRAGSVATMDRVFAFLVGRVGVSVWQASAMCSTSPARALGLDRLGAIVPGAWADLVVLDSSLRVQSTWVGGRQVWPLQ